MFYANQNGDAASILSNIKQTGIFLVRPQSKKTASNEQRYVRLGFK